MLQTTSLGKDTHHLPYFRNMDTLFRSTLINGFRLNLSYTHELVGDVPEQLMCQQPKGFTNHPSFTIGHLVTAVALSAKIVGVPYDVPADWDELFRRKGPADSTLASGSLEGYPTKSQLLNALDTRGEALILQIMNTEHSVFSESYDWKFSRHMPTKGEALAFMCLIHHSWHIGQLAEWRRFMNLPPVLRNLLDGD